MKKLSKISVFTLVFAAFLLGNTGFVKAETGTSFGQGTEVRTKSEDSNLKRDSKIFTYPAVEVQVKANIEASHKIALEKCATLSTDQKKICVDEVERAFKAGYEAWNKAKIDGVSAENRAKIEEKMRLETRVDANGKLKVEDKKSDEQRSEDQKHYDGQRIKDLLKLRTNIEKRDERGTQENPKPVVQILNNYFLRVLKNLSAVYDRVSGLADRVDSRLTKLSDEGVDITTSKKFAAEARAELKLAKASIDAASDAYKTESPNAKPLRSSVVNDRGVTLTTSEDEYNACVQKGGKVMDYDKNRCSFEGEKTVYINPSLIERTVLLTTSIESNTSSFPKTLANIKAAKEHLKLAHRNLVSAISNLKPGLNGMGDKDVKPVGTVKVESNGAVKVE